MTDKDELLLGIVEKIADNVEDLKNEITELKIEQARQGVIHSVNSVNFEEHMARTKANEQRIILVEKHVFFVNSALKVITAIGGVSLFVLKVLPLLKNLL